MFLDLYLSDKSVFRTKVDDLLRIFSNVAHIKTNLLFSRYASTQEYHL